MQHAPAAPLSVYSWYDATAKFGLFGAHRVCVMDFLRQRRQPWKQVAFRTHYGRYLCAEDNGTYVADRSVAGPWEYFQVVDVDGDDVVALRNRHGLFVGVGRNGRLTSFEDAGVDAQWWLEDAYQHPGMHTLRSRRTSKFLCTASANEAPVVDRDAVGEWERLRLEVVPITVRTQDDKSIWPWEKYELVELTPGAGTDGGIVAFKTEGARYLGTDSNGKIDSMSTIVGLDQEWIMRPGPIEPLYTFQNERTKKFLSLPSRHDVLIANRDAPSVTETFTVQPAV
ncbi:Fascin domain-containing protein [Plasmodiophora brassicae]